MAPMLICLASASVSVSLLLVVLMALKGPLLKRYRANALWCAGLLLMALLLCPWRPALLQRQVSPEVAAGWTAQEAGSQPAATQQAAGAVLLAEWQDERRGKGQGEVRSQAQGALATSDRALEPARLILRLDTILLYIWLTGAVLTLALRVTRHLRFMHLTRRWRRPLAGPVQAQLEEQCAALGMQRPFAWHAPLVSSPMVVGLVRPVLLWPGKERPNEEIPQEQQALMLRHELLHIQRKDLLGIGLIELASCMHWFNPLLIWARRELQTLCELACDEAVLRGSEADHRTLYFRAMLSALPTGKPLPLSTRFDGGLKNMKFRMERVLDRSSHKAGAMMMAVVLMLALFTGNVLAVAAEGGLDPALQQAAEAALQDQDPRAAVVVMDMEGRVLAMAGSQDGRPNALMERGAPGFAFAPITALTALTTGQLLPEEQISDGGSFMEYTTDISEAPICWIPMEQQYKHQHQTVVEGLSNNCDYFFYTLGSRVGDAGLVEMAQALGLDGLSGLEVQGEALSQLACQQTLYDPTRPMEQQATQYPGIVEAALVKHLGEQAKAQGLEPADEALAGCAKALMDMAVSTSQIEWVASIRPILMEELGMSRDMVMQQVVVGDTYNYLCGIKWHGSRTIQAAVGLSVAETTPIAMARYWTALWNGGYVYASSLTGDQEPELMRDLSGELGPYLPLIHKGLRGILDRTEKGRAAFASWNMEEDWSNSSCLLASVEAEDGQPATWAVAAVPFDDPKVTLVVYLPQSDQTLAAQAIFKDVTDAYRSR